MPWRSLAIASVRSARSRCRSAIRVSSSAASVSAIRLTGPMPSRSRIKRSSRAAVSAGSAGTLSSATPGDFGERLGCDTHPLADIAGKARQGFVCAIAQPFEPRQALASLAQCLIGQARGVRGLAQPPLADGQRVGRPAARLGSAGDCGAERLALGGDHCRARRQAGDLRLQRAAPFDQCNLLRGGIRAALTPGTFLEVDRGQALAPTRRFMGEPLDCRARVCFAPARLGRRGARLVERRAGRFCLGEGRQITLDLFRLRLGFGEIGADLFEKVDRGGEPGLRGQFPPADLGLLGARPRQRRLGVGQRLARRSAGLGCMLTLGTRRGGAALGRQSRGLQGGDLALQHGEAVGMPQMLGGGGRPAAERDEPVPTPQTTLTVDQPLARRQARLEAAPGLLIVDPARLRRGCAREQTERRRLRPTGKRPRARQRSHARRPLRSTQKRAASASSPFSERRLKFIAKRGADRGLEARRDPQRRQDRRRLARIRRRCKQPAQSLGLCGKPSQLSIDLARQIERRLLAGEPVYDLDLGRLDDRRDIARPALQPASRRQRQRSPPRAQPAPRPVLCAAAPLPPGAPPTGRGVLRDPFGDDRARRGARRRPRRLRSPAAAPPPLRPSEHRLRATQLRRVPGPDHPPPRPG